MIVQKLTFSEIKTVYNCNMPLDFPKEEIRPWSNFEMMLEQNNYAGYGFYLNNEIVCYALFVVNSTENTALLDFLAVNSSYRGKGIGTQVIAEINKIFKDLDCVILEVENPKFAKSSEDLIVRNKRIDFYKNNSVMTSGITSYVMGVNFSIMYIKTKQEKSDKQICEILNSIYNIMFVNNEEVKVFMP